MAFGVLVTVLLRNCETFSCQRAHHSIHEDLLSSSYMLHVVHLQAGVVEDV